MAEVEIKDDIDKLKSQPISDLSTLLSLLCRPLDAADLLPPQFRRHSTPTSLFPNVIKHFPTIQRALLENILPTWNHILSEQNLSAITDQYFCPDAFSFTSTAAGEVVLISYSTILSLPLNEYSIHFLSLLAKAYPIDRLHQAAFASSPSLSRSVVWEDCVRNVIAVPPKVANFLGGRKEIPDELEHGSYFNNVCLRSEYLIWSSSLKPLSTEKVQSITYLLTKLVHVGLFPPYLSTSRSQPAFFKTCMQILRERIRSSESYSSIWSTIFFALPSSTAIQSPFISLFSSLENVPALDTSPRTRSLVKREATLLLNLVGKLSVDRRELWDSVSVVIVGREWDEGKARVLVCWVAVDDDALKLLLSKILETWISPDHIKHSLLSRHHYMTSLLLVTISYFPLSASHVASLALSPSFVSGVGIYIMHLDKNVRRCGMLVAEEVARRAGKKLEFGGWDGGDAPMIWIRSMRDLMSARDIDFDPAELEMSAALDTEAEASPQPSSPTSSQSQQLSGPPPSADSDDESVEGYASSGASDRSPSPTPSDLAEIEKDPTLNVGIRKIPRPVYLAQLGELVRSTTAGLKSGENEEPQKIEMALGCGEELIRRKRAFGSELEENAVNLVYAFIGLQNTYELDGFDANRQGIVTGLVACSPRKAAPAIVEEFFKNQYSTDQRFVMLTALALGARELASLPVPPSSVPSERTSFPTKRLPPALHRKLILGNPVHGLLMDISQSAIDKSRDRSADLVPEFARERQLRLQRPPKISSASSVAQSSVPSQTNVAFTDIAAEYFICPLVNRFWLFLRDEQTRESLTSHHKDPLYRYRGAGTGLILNAMLLSQFLSTLGVLIHAARNAPQMLAVIAPDGLELAVTLGTRPISQMEEEDDGENEVSGDAEGRSGGGKEASVLTSALELAVIILDGCLDLDGGKSLGLDHTSLVLGTGEWAGKLLARLEKGILIPGGGGAQELRLRRAAAGVVLKVDDLTSKWGRSMVDVF